jgi:hypothetical protein
MNKLPATRRAVNMRKPCPSLIRLTRLLGLVLLVLMFALSAAAVSPALANSQCKDQAWIELPSDDILAFLPESWDWTRPFSVALSKNYAVLVWPTSSFGAPFNYKAMVGSLITDDQGTIVWFNTDKVHTVNTSEAVSRPSVAINDSGQVIFAFEAGPENVSYQACQVTGHRDTAALSCGKVYIEIAQGQTPSVALTNDGYAVIVYEGNVFQELWYRTGLFDGNGLSVDWNNGHHYDHGTNPYVAVNHGGDGVVEVHHGSTNWFHPNKLFIKVGRSEDEFYTITWGKSHEYESDGYLPTVAISGATVIEFHKSAHHNRTYYRYGTYDAYAHTVSWHGGSSRHRYGSGDDGDQNACVAASWDGKLLMSFNNPDTSPSTMIYGGIGGMGYDYTCPWPTVTTNGVSHITLNSAVSGGNVTSPGYSNVTARGICWSTSRNPTTNDSHTKSGKGIGSFTSRLSKLTPQTGYYVRAYATNSHGTGYGDNVYFHTAQGTPTALTFYPFFKTSEGALAGGAITSQGGADVIDRGLCWSKQANPTIQGDCQSAGSGLGGFNEFITGLEPLTNYYLRAYGSNEYGTGYGANQMFTTLHPGLATVFTDDPTGITSSSAILGGEVTKSGSDLVTERGVVWDTSPMPNLSNDKAAVGSGQGVFSQNLTGFTPDVTYYVRAYAINASGHSYGQDKLFTASDDVLPRVVTTAPYGETATSALSGGHVTNPGQSPVTERGVCWSVSPNPDISGPHTEDGSGMGQFHSAITGLSPETGYYVRAYATNSAGISYGDEYFFHAAHPSAPTVHTLAVTESSTTSATVGGQVITQGGAEVSARGICWSTQPHPTLSDNVVQAGSGTGLFQAPISGLTPETVYYARAFATNQYGTSYGHIINFRTTFCPYPCR